jgi:hypothetical protein
MQKGVSLLLHLGLQPAFCKGIRGTGMLAACQELTARRTSRAARSPLASAPWTVPAKPVVSVASPANTSVPAIGVARTRLASPAQTGT